MSTRIRVENLVPSTTEERLKRLVAPLATVVSVTMEPPRSRSSLAAVLELATEEQALYTALVLNGRKLSGRVVSAYRIEPFVEAAKQPAHAARFGRTP